MRVSFQLPNLKKSSPLIHSSGRKAGSLFGPVGRRTFIRYLCLGACLPLPKPVLLQGPSSSIWRWSCSSAILPRQSAVRPYGRPGQNKNGLYRRCRAKNFHFCFGLFTNGKTYQANYASFP